MAQRQNLAEPDGLDTVAGPEEDFFPTIKPVQVIEDPEMDPGSPRWSPRKYFGSQPRDVIIVPRNESDSIADPTGKAKITIPVSINGYRLMIDKGVPTKVPRDFAVHLIQIGAAFLYSQAVDAKELR